MVKNKAQISQIFIYIMAIFIFSLIVFYGYKGVRTIIDKGDKTIYLKFKTELESTIENSKSYGDVKIKKFMLPSKTKRICIVDLSNKPNTKPTDVPEIVWDSWKEKTANIFLLPPVYSPLKIEGIKINYNNNPYLCLEIKNSRFSIKLKGLGDSVEITN